MSLLGDKRTAGTSPPRNGVETPAVRSRHLVFLSCQTGADPAGGELAAGLEAQTRQMLANVDALLEAAGGSNADLVTVTLMFADIGYFKAVDRIYADWLPPREEVPLPCCTAFSVPSLPGGALVAIEGIASIAAGSQP